MGKKTKMMVAMACNMINFTGALLRRVKSEGRSQWYVEGGWGGILFIASGLEILAASADGPQTLRFASRRSDWSKISLDSHNS